MFYHIDAFLSPLAVKLNTRHSDVVPSKIEFELSDGSVMKVEVAAFQKLRGLHDHNTYFKINLIKDFKGLTGLGLKDAKDIVEWFLNNVDKDVR